MIEATMDPRKVRIRKKNFVMLLLYFCVIVLSQVDASLVDPSRIGMELQTFARDALGVDEMQVRKFATSESMISALFSPQ